MLSRPNFLIFKCETFIKYIAWEKWLPAAARNCFIVSQISVLSSSVSMGTSSVSMAWREKRTPHCEKSLFVLASRQKIPVLRTENSAVDTRTICLPPIEFFKITHARKAMAGKSRLETTDTAVKSPPSGIWRDNF